jgi:hypothetical protein
MQIEYSKHIGTRIALRKIEYDLPMKEGQKEKRVQSGRWRKI